MGRGKYSPAQLSEGPYTFNAYGEIPPEHPGRELYDSKIHYGDYDADGYDRYGYSAWRADGTYAGSGSGVDRFGHTEDDYLMNFDDDHFNEMQHSGVPRPLLSDRGIVGSLGTDASPDFVTMVSNMLPVDLVRRSQPMLHAWIGDHDKVQNIRARPDISTMTRRQDRVSIQADLIVTFRNGYRQGIRVLIQGSLASSFRDIIDIGVHAPIHGSLQD